MKWILTVFIFLPSVVFGRNIALIGDSLIAQASPYVHTAMPCANRIPGNFRDSSWMRDHIDSSMEGLTFDVIYFDVGAWDFSRRLQPGQPGYDPNRMWQLDPSDTAPVMDTLDEYQTHLVGIIAKLRQHLNPGGVLIYMTTTDVPEGSAGRLSSDVGPYNTVAHEVMNSRGVITDMMHSFMLPYAYLHADNHGNLVHYVSAGRQIMASHIVDVLQANGGC